MREIFAKMQKAADRYTIIASTNELDRDNEIVDPGAFKESLTPYLEKNPVILWAHDYRKPPIAKATGGAISESDLRLDIEWAPTPEAKEIKSLYDGGFLNAFSIGFLPTKDGVQQSPEGISIFTKAELLEVSAVPIPANRGATIIRNALKNGVELDHVKDWIAPQEDEEKLLVEVAEILAKYEVPHVSRMAVVYADEEE